MGVSAEQAVCSLGLPASYRPPLSCRAMGTGACGRCAAEVAQGTRPQSQQCYAFSGTFEGASVCQTCGPPPPPPSRPSLRLMSIVKRQ